MKILLKFKCIFVIILYFYLFIVFLTGCSQSNPTLKSSNTPSANSNPITRPKYFGKATLIIDENAPNFNEADLTTKSFEIYSPLDELGRCGVAYANIGQDIMPTTDRDSISSVKPSGWHSVSYDIIQAKYLYNRSHLIGFQLTAENANERNIITGTRYLNVELMLPYENMVADYIIQTNNHVLYRVTPLFEGNNLVPFAVQMEAKSVEDNGKSIQFNVILYNIQPGIIIDYANGDSILSSDKNNVPINNANTSSTIRGNSKSKIYHCPGQNSYEEMLNSKYLVIFNSEDEAKSAGYRKANL